MRSTDTPLARVDLRAPARAPAVSVMLSLPSAPTPGAVVTNFIVLLGSDRAGDLRRLSWGVAPLLVGAGAAGGREAAVHRMPVSRPRRCPHLGWWPASGRVAPPPARHARRAAG